MTLQILLTSTSIVYGQGVSTKVLLEEMINREAITKFPYPAYTCAQFSSYDRSSKQVNGPGWFANWDRSQRLRIEQNNGRREFVMMDIDGPGAIVCFWVTSASYNRNGILRIYIDNKEEPVIEGEIFKLISGNELAPEPLGSDLPILSEYRYRGHNLYLPIPYAKHCKVTYESSAQSWEPGGKTGESLYYAINCRTYEDGTNVTSFSLSDLEDHRDLINRVSRELLSDPVITNGVNDNINGVIAPNKELQKSFFGEKGIYQIKFKIKAKNYEQALRSTVLNISFDGDETVWCPIGDFFGIGYKLYPVSSFYSSAQNDSTLTANWIMPFKETCTLTFVTTGSKMCKY